MIVTAYNQHVRLLSSEPFGWFAPPKSTRAWEPTLFMESLQSKLPEKADEKRKLVITPDGLNLLVALLAVNDVSPRVHLYSKAREHDWPIRALEAAINLPMIIRA